MSIQQSQTFVIYNGQKFNIENQALCLTNKSIKDIEKIQGLEKLSNLHTLDLSNNQITQINGLNKLKKLEILCLNNNQITEIKGLDNLENLRYYG